MIDRLIADCRNASYCLPILSSACLPPSIVRGITWLVALPDDGSPALFILWHYSCRDTRLMGLNIMFCFSCDDLADIIYPIDGRGEILITLPVYRLITLGFRAICTICFEISALRIPDLHYSIINRRRGIFIIRPHDLCYCTAAQLIISYAGEDDRYALLL
eukprot:scaffold226180_cov43-Cyclotella_meneghiniana.AAC.1